MDSSTKWFRTIAFIGIALLQQAMSVSVTYLGENVAWTATNDLRAELAWHALNLDNVQFVRDMHAVPRRLDIRTREDGHTVPVATLNRMERDTELMKRIASAHSGVVLKSTGDGLLIRFGSAVQAVSEKIAPPDTPAPTAQPPASIAPNPISTAPAM